MKWQPKKTMPKEGQFLVTLRVYSAGTHRFLHWDTHVICIDDEGELEEDMGWAMSDYELWCPLPDFPDPT